MERRRRTVSRAARALAGGAAALVVAVCLAAPVVGADEAAKAPRRPSYVLPNLIAGAMSLAVLAIACKRSQNT